MLNVVIVSCAILFVAVANGGFTTDQFNDITKETGYIKLIDEVIGSAVETLTNSIQLRDYREKFATKFHVETVKAMNEISTRVLKEFVGGQCFNNAVTKIVADEAKIRHCVNESAESVNGDTDEIRNIMEKTTKKLETFKEQVHSCFAEHTNEDYRLWQCTKKVLKQVGEIYGPLVIVHHYITPHQLEAATRYESGDVICTNGFDINSPDSEIKPIVEEYDKCIREKITN